MDDTDPTRRDVLKRGALLGGALVPAALAVRGRAEASAETDAPRGPFDVRDFGARGDGLTDDTAALQAAIDACHDAGGGTVLVPSGIYLSAAFELNSRVTLHLEAGATVLGSPRLEDYPVEGEDASGESEHAGLVTARDAERVAIVGRGTIDGNALAFHDQTTSHIAPDLERKYTRQKEGFLPEGTFFEHGPLAHGPRPGNLVRFFGCRDVLVHGVTIQNSPTWTSHYRDCENVTIEAVRINSDASDRMIPNDDGIDLARCRDVRILGCDIDTGDDCIALFGSQRVVVTGCTLSTRSVAIRVGYDTETIRDCVFSDIVIHGAHRGLGVFVRGEGSVENVIFSDIVMRTRLYTGHWWGKGEPIHVSAVFLHPGATELGRIRGITFARIRAEAEAGAVIWGSRESRIGDVSLDDVRLRIVRGPQSEAYGGNIDLRGARDMAHSLFERDLPALLAERIDRLTLRGLEVSWGEDVPAFFTHAVECREFGEVEIERFRGRQARGTGSALRLADGGDVEIRDSRATEGTDVFVEATDVIGRVALADNDLRAATTPAAPPDFGGAGRER
jgi:hypothetical protein